MARQGRVKQMSREATQNERFLEEGRTEVEKKLVLPSADEERIGKALTFMRSSLVECREKYPRVIRGYI